MSGKIWDLNNDFRTLSEELLNLFFPESGLGVKKKEREISGLMNVFRFKNKTRIDFLVPYLNEESLKVFASDNDTLIVTGEVGEQYEKENSDDFENACRSFMTPNFHREIKVSGEHYDLEKMEIKLDRGILSLTIPLRVKTKKNELREIPIK